LGKFADFIIIKERFCHFEMFGSAISYSNIYIICNYTCCVYWFVRS